MSGAFESAAGNVASLTDAINNIQKQFVAQDQGRPVSWADTLALYQLMATNNLTLAALAITEQSRIEAAAAQDRRAGL